jgi:small subunit ribosomal protein S4
MSAESAAVRVELGSWFQQRQGNGASAALARAVQHNRRMPTSRGPRHKTSRRFGVDIYGTGGKSLQRRLGTPPGGLKTGRRRRQSIYAETLTEKQKTKAIYGIDERPFRRYFSRAESRPGAPGENLLVFLERRLDNVVYRLGMARTRPMARQLVSHGHVTVGGKRVDIPSFLVEPGQAIGLDETARKMPVVEEEMAANRPLPTWLERRPDGTGLVQRLPERSEIDVPVNEALVVEHYSR